MGRKDLLATAGITCSLLMLLLGAAIAGAQAPPGAPGPRAEEIAFEEIPVVITAAKRPQRLTEAPSTVEVITSEDLANWGALTLDQALRMISGIDVRMYGIRNEIYIRGVAGPVLCLVDGRRTNSAFDGSFRGDLQLVSVERIEIVKGPGSALYGPNAFGGVINIITKSSADIDGVRVSVGGGSESTFLADLLAGLSSSPLSGVLTYRHYRTDGQRLLNDNDGQREDNVFAKVEYRGLTLSAGYDELDREIQGRVGRESPTDDLLDRSGFVDLSFGERWGEFGLNARGFYNQGESDFSLSGQSLVTESDVWGAEGQGTWKINEGNLLIGGLDLRWDEGAQDDVDHSARNTGVYLEYESRPLQPLILTLGARYDAHSVYEDAFTPRLSAVYLAGEATSLRFSYGEAFRAPSIQDLYVDFFLTPTVQNVGNPDLKPEKLRTYELGMLHAFNEWIDGNLNVYYTRARDLIVVQPVFYGGIIHNIPMNIGEAEIRGLEAGLKGSPWSFLSLQANYSYEDAEDEEGEDLPYIAHHKFNLVVTLLPAKGISLNLKTRYVGKRDGYDFNRRAEAELEDYTVEDVILRWSWKRVTAQAAVYNLFDRRYEETMGYPLGERSFLATVGYRF